MASRFSDPTLTAILALQGTSGWAGKAWRLPPRLGWWDTELIDEPGGGGSLARRLPQTHACASLEAARRVDAKARDKMGAPEAGVPLQNW